MNRLEQGKLLSASEISQKLARVKATFIGIPVTLGKNGYPYSLFTLTDFTPAMKPDLLEDMADLIVYYGSFERADIVVSEADRGGGPLAHAVALRTNLPYTLANWYPKEISGEIAVEASVGFSGEGHIYLNGIIPGQKAILIDDLLSSGGTAVALLDAIKKGDAEPIAALFVGEKLGIGGRRRIEEKYAIPIKALVQFAVNNDETTDPV